MHHSLVVRFAFAVLMAAALVGCSPERKKARVLERAGEYFKAQEYEKARVEYMNVLKLHPDDMTATERLARIWLERGAPLRAAPYLIKLKTLAPGNLEMRVKLAQIMLSVGQAGEARKEALAVLERSGSFPDALVVLTEAARSPADVKTAEEELQKVTDKSTIAYQIATANLAGLRGQPDVAKTTLQRAVARDPKSPEARLALAGFLALHNDPTQAVAEYKAAAEAAPVRSIARIKYALALAQTGSLPQAKAYLTEMTQQAPDFLPAWRGLVQVALFEKKFPEALAMLQKLFERDMADHEGRVLRARAWLAQGEVKRAIDDLEKFGQEFPGLGLEKHVLGLAYLQSGDRMKAIAALQAAVAHNPDNMEALLLWGQLALSAGAAQPVAVTMADLVSRRPNLQAYFLLIEAMRTLGKLEPLATAMKDRLKNAPKDAQMNYLLGLVLTHQQKPAEARKSFETTLELAPNHLAAAIELMSLDLRERKPAAVLDRVRPLLVKAPNSPALHLMAARAHAVAGRWDDTEAAVLKTLELDPKHAGAHALITELALVQKDRPETPGRMERFLAKRPDDERTVLAAAQFFHAMKQYPKVRDIYEAHLAKQPEAGPILNNLAALYGDHLNDPERALELARKARKLFPNSPAIADTLGWILYKQKNYGEALPLLQESAAKIGQSAEIQYHLGMASKMTGNEEAAVTALRLAANSRADFAGKDEAKRELAILEKKFPTAPAPAPVSAAEAGTPPAK